MSKLIYIVYLPSTEQHSITYMDNLNLKIDFSNGETKQQQLVNELCRVIKTELNEGDNLPSVNTISNSLQISRDTVFKAYTELKRRGIVDSTPQKGYFVNRELNKVLLLLDYYTPFKDIVYREIEKQLDSTYSIDLVFHHYNKELFETVIHESIGRYNSYIIMNFDTLNLEFSEPIGKLDPSKVLLLDIPVKNLESRTNQNYSYLWQDFDNAVFQSLENLSDKIKKYSSFHIVMPDRLNHPAITIEAFNKYCQKNAIEHSVIKATSDFDIQKNSAYFILRQNDIYKILSFCKENNLQVGKDVGILAYNDIPLYEFVSCGITVISTNFKEMGKKASQFILQRETVQKYIPTQIILRNSL